MGEDAWVLCSIASSIGEEIYRRPFKRAAGPMRRLVSSKQWSAAGPKGNPDKNVLWNPGHSGVTSPLVRHA